MMESRVLGSRYELLEKVGMGGMAVVYKAVDRMLNRNVAIKILREEFKENEEFIRRFKVESQAAACLSHQNIVQIYDVGEEDGIHYIVMELLEGITLKQHMISMGGKLSRREATNFSMQICRALEHAHQKHVVHRDIKPQNIVLTESGKIKVADFGIARAANNSTMINSGTQAVGSAHYLSPEQARGGYTDQRSDIYSLGVVMYEMFTGTLPFDGEESISVAMKHLNEEPPLPSEINPDIAPGIEAIILRAMRKEQRFRYENATQILEDLVTVYQAPNTDVRVLNACKGEENKDIAKVSSSSRSKSRHGKKKKQKSRKGLLIAAIAFCAVMIVLLAIALKLLFFPGGDKADIPKVIGMTHEEASFECEKASRGDIDFTVIVERSEHSDAKKGTIISQAPEGGREIKRSREIKVVLSLGPVVLELDDYVGKKYTSVEKQLKAKGLKVIIQEENNDTYEEGVIFRQIPDEGTKMAEDDEITLFVSRGTENTVIPNVIGKTADAAVAAIERNGLKVGTIKEIADSRPKGEVVKLSKSASQIVPMGTVVDIFVSSGTAEGSNGEVIDNNSDTKPQKSVNVSLSGITKNKDVLVELKLGGKPYYKKTHNTSTGSVTVSVKIDKTTSVDVYYDGVYITTKEVKY